MASRRSRCLGLVALLVIWTGGLPAAVAGPASSIDGAGASSAALHPLEAAALNGVGQFRFVGVSGAGASTDSELEFSYSGAGCMSATGGQALNGDWDVDLHFATGDEITFMRFFYFDSDPAADITMFLFKFDGAGGLTTLASVSSSGSAGFGSAGVALSHVVSNTTGGLVLRFTQETSTVNSLRSCAARVLVQAL